MRKTYLIAAAAAMLAACSSDKLDTGQNTVEKPLEPGTVGFSAYTQRTTTRAGYNGDMDMTQLQKDPDTEGGGFGVFGFYTDNKEYDQLAIPNFFWNQKVKWNASKWEYEPVKYWPNEYGNSAISEDYDKVSFFAYAPYVEVDANSGKVVDSGAGENTWGITQLSRNTAGGDPIVKYIASFDPTKAVDLMWGVCDDPDWPIVVDGKNQNINGGTKGLPWIDVQRPSQVDQYMKFTFKHALAKLNVQVDYVADAYLNGASETINETETRIWIRSIRFNGIAMKGALNLNNTETGANKPYWMNYNGIGELESDADITIYDGRKDGKEGIAGAAASNEKVLGLNPKVIQNPDAALAVNQPKHATANPTGTVGVTKASQNVFNGASADGCIYVIPTDEEMVVEIVYDVETVDPNLATTLADGVTKGSSIENRISKTISFAPKTGTTTAVNSLQPGNAYQLKLHLGMNSVKLDAAVLDWEDLQPGTEANLPSNMPEVAAGSTNYPVDVAADATTYTFAVTGLKVGESLTASSADPNILSVSIAPAATQTWEIVTVTLAPNTSVSDVDNTITITRSTGSDTSVKITQKAHALALSASAIDPANKKITLATLGTVAAWPASSTTTDPAYVTINRSGVDLTYNDPVAAANEFSVDAGTGEITLFDDFKVGETYIITVKVGDAPVETISFKIGGAILADANVAVGGTVTPASTLVGGATIPATGAWAESTLGAVVTIDPDNGQVTGVANGTSTITLTVTPGTAAGYFYLPTATCIVTVP